MRDYWKAITVSATWIAGCSVADHYGDASAIVTGGNRGVHARLPLEADDARVFIQDGAVAGRGEETVDDGRGSACRFIVIEGSRS